MWLGEARQGEMSLQVELLEEDGEHKSKGFKASDWAAGLPGAFAVDHHFGRNGDRGLDDNFGVPPERLPVGRVYGPLEFPDGICIAGQVACIG